MSVAGVVQGAYTAYHVGNSLTNQTTVHVGATIDQLTASRGISYTWGRHIRCGSSLTATVANPSDVCVGPIAPFGTFENALGSHVWDAVTLQPYGGPYQSERAAFNQLVDLAQMNAGNGDTAFYLFSAWPQGHSPDSYATRWERAFDPATDVAEARWSRDYALTLLADIRSDQAGTSVYVIPSGEVLHRVNGLVADGAITTYTPKNYDGVEDPYHLDTAGSYISRLTLFATLFKESPAGLPVPANTGLSAQDAALIQQTVWDVVSEDPSLTGVPEPAGLLSLLGLAGLSLRRTRQSR